MKIVFKIAFLVVFIGFAIYLAVYIFSPKQQSRVYYIALVGPMTGKYQDYGKAMVRGAELYLDKINSALEDKKIKLLIFDDQNKKELAIKRAEKIAQDKRILLVLGHYFSSCSIKAGEIYRKSKIPAITGSATNVKVTKNNPWYFRVTFNDRQQGNFLAYYSSKILKYKSYSIIYDDDAFGSYLATTYSSNAKKLGMKKNLVRSFNNRNKLLSSQLLNYVEELKQLQTKGILFLATHANEGAQIVKYIRDNRLSIQIIGPDALGGTAFRDAFRDELLEKENRGYYTNGIYTTTPLIFDVANSKAQVFKQEFTAKYKDQPDWIAAYYHDAALLAISAILWSLDEDESDEVFIRNKIRKYFAKLDSLDQSIEGVTGFNYFDKNGDCPKPIPIGLYNSGKIVSALTQLQPVENLKRIPNLEDALEKEQVVQIGKQHYYKTSVVYTGLEINEISNFNLKDSSYSVDFYLWLRYRTNENINKIEFLNCSKQPDIKKPIRTKLKDGLQYHCYRLKHTFKSDFAYHDYPFDRQVLNIQFRHSFLPRQNLIFVSDSLGMADQKSQDAKDILGNIEGWNVLNFLYFQEIFEKTSSLGDPDLIGKFNVIEYSGFNVEVHLERDAISYLIKSMIPLLILILLSYSVFYIPAEQIGVRSSIGVTSLLSSIVLHLKLSGELPQIGYMVAIEYYFIIAYILIVYGISITITGYSYVYVDNLGRANKINYYSKFLYPILFILTITLLNSSIN